jgi:DNA-directed RNA polymerase specialized sigma24 family protein
VARSPKVWTLGRDAFERLLALLDADRDRAGAQYERIRAKLTKFFEWRGCAAADDYVDRTMDRVARALEQGTEVRAADPYSFFHGVALNILREYQRDPAAAWQPLGDAVAGGDTEPGADPAESDDERRRGCLDECLQAVPVGTRQALLAYHGEHGRARIEARQRLAAGLGIPLNALRIRMHRTRADLEGCVAACLRRAAASGMKRQTPFRH